MEEGSTFALEQAQVGATAWELTAIHVHLQGNALLFKSVSLEEDEERSRYQPEAADMTLDQAVTAVMRQPGEASARAR